MKAAIWARVSTDSQDTQNQVQALRDYAQRRDLEPVRTYEVHESAWVVGAHYLDLAQVYADAQAGEFNVLLVWSLDRLTRQGSQAMLEIVARLGRLGGRGMVPSRALDGGQR